MTCALVQIDPLEVVRIFPDGIPEPVMWPDGTASHAVHVGFRYDRWALVGVVTTPDQPHEFYQITETKNSLVDNNLVIARTWVASDLGTTKQVLCARIDEQAETARLPYLTSGTGQALVYHQKMIEAQAVQSDTAPKLEKYPLLSATVGIEGDSLKEVAGKVGAQARKWLEKAAEIERIRIGAKVAINASKSVDEAVAVVVTWP